MTFEERLREAIISALHDREGGVYSPIRVKRADLIIVDLIDWLADKGCDRENGD